MKIRCGAVPEHFFYPWKRWLSEEKDRSERWLWQDFPGGSGEMLQALAENRIDAAFLLTESALLHQSQNNTLKILYPFVISPLHWGIFTGAANSANTVSDGKTYAISRFRSGSHLMAILEADMRGKQIRDEDWKIAGNLEGARKMLGSVEADLFFWEKWMTRPFVESGEFRMLGVFPSPWPAFVFCVNREWMNRQANIEQLEKDYKEVCKLAGDIKSYRNQYSQEISRIYHLNNQTTGEWLEQVEWAKVSSLSMNFLEEAAHLMRKAGIISPEIPYRGYASRKES